MVHAPFHRASFGKGVEYDADTVRAEQGLYGGIRRRWCVAAKPRQPVKRQGFFQTERGQELQVQLRLVQVAPFAGEVHALVAAEPVPPPACGADALRDVGVFAPGRHFPMREHVDGVRDAQLAQFQRGHLRTVMLELVQGEHRVHMAALTQNGCGIGAAHEGDAYTGEAFLQQPGHGQGHHHVADAVRPAQQDMLRIGHGAGRVVWRTSGVPLWRRGGRCANRRGHRAGHLEAGIPRGTWPRARASA